ncbi:sensor histidine kinase [Streptomyces uncialis]|uniref:histidine kinase n=1 Tax=Streptomyces uncialis TaxID=1048205 RepID=A0A1Q4V1H4_9ACTN|nr:nitrate- and nitrite sensing domain-containing protein [Streptomyces uncialis]OKH91590.1 hypothetical protein AB852_29020 [Streptomyces uncialis]
MQGRFKRDGSGPAEPEPRGGTDRGSSPQHAQNPGPVSMIGSADSARQSAPGGPGPGPAGGPPPAPKAKSKGKGPHNTGSRVALRNWRISTRLVSLLALPVVAATSLGALRINQSMDDIQQLDNMKLLTDLTKQATQLAAALQDERDSSAGPLAHGGKASDFDVKGPRDKTDRARQAFLEGTKPIDDVGGREGLEGINSSVRQIASQLRGLSDARAAAYTDRNSSSQTVDAYSMLIEELLALSQDMAQATSNPEMVQRTRALAAFSSAKEYASVQRAVIAAALPANNKDKGSLSELDRRYAANAFSKEDAELTGFKTIYEGDAKELLKPIDDGNSNIKESMAYADRVLESPGAMENSKKRSYKDWLDASTTKINAMTNIERTLLGEMEDKARELRDESEQGAIISGAVILLVLGVSLVGAFIVARSMIRSLRRLQDTATKVAQDRLPELVKQLSESDPQDVDTSVESVGVHSRDEIGQVAAAFDDVHREAVRLAAEQALLRGNVNAMFTNLSRRSQGLIQRQLSLISELESREADPDQLSSLFKLDHLATRMRRNGENLLVLAGEEPGRRWTRPVPLVDVLRAAASEVEQYERIELSSVPGTEVAGRVVNDLVHLLAELLENATSFSSPQTKVKVTGHALPDGRVLIEIHDTGIGLSPEDLAAINERLASPPTVDVSVSRRMGLFVVGRLSQRHGIRIQLRPSDSGGTTALVMLPVDVAQGNKKPPVGKPGTPGIPGGPAAAQASAGAAAARRGPGPSVGNGPGTPGYLGPGPQGGPRAALPGRDGAPQVPGGRPAPAGAGAFGQGPAGPQGLQSTGSGLPGRPGGQGGQPGQQGPGYGPNQGQRPGQGQHQGLPYADRGQGVPGQGGPGAFDGAPGFGNGPRQDGFPDDPSGGRQGAPRRGDGFDGFGARPPGAERQDGRPGGPGQGQDPSRQRGRRPQLPARGAPRAELPGGGDAQRAPSWSDGTAQPPVPRAPQDSPRGHEEHDSTTQFPRFDEYSAAPPVDTSAFPPVDDRQQAGATSEFTRPDYDAPPPQDFGSPSPDPGVTRSGEGEDGPYVRSDVFGAPAGQDPSDTGQFPVPQVTGYDDRGQGGPGGYGQDPSDTGQFERPAPEYGRPPAQQGHGPEAPRQNRPTEPEALPPAGPGDGRTPLFDTLETDWFRGQRAERPESDGTLGEQAVPQGQPEQSGHPGQGPRPSLPARSADTPTGDQNSARPGPGQGPGQGGTGSWRTSPNDELVRQAERVRQPTAGGITTSGLPRRVPRANLVAGTAQQQQHQTGPQVSRAPDDVRGRLTNLRRGIQQGRQANTGQSTGNHPRPTHQQEH